MTKEKAQEVLQVLRKHYPRAKMILQWGNNFELLVAIILSAQCTDKKVNEVTAKLFPKYRQERKEFVSEYGKYSRIDLTKEELNKGKDPYVAHIPQDDNLNREELIEIVNFAFVPIAELE